MKDIYLERVKFIFTSCHCEKILLCNIVVFSLLLLFLLLILIMLRILYVYMYYTGLKKGGSTLVMITLENLD